MFQNTLVQHAISDQLSLLEEISKQILIHFLCIDFLKCLCDVKENILGSQHLLKSSRLLDLLYVKRNRFAIQSFTNGLKINDILLNEL